MKAWLGLLLLASTAGAQGVRFDGQITTVASNVAPNAEATILAVPQASVTVCTYPQTAIPCATAPIFSDAALTVPTSPHLTTDAQGHYGFWAAAGTYVITASALGTNYPARTITLGGTGSGGGITTNQLNVALSKLQPSLGFTPENLANRAQRNGYAPLGSDAKVPLANLPAIPAAINLQHAGTPNGSQAILNIVPGNNITVTDDGAGDLTIGSTATGSSNSSSTGFVLIDTVSGYTQVSSNSGGLVFGPTTNSTNAVPSVTFKDSSGATHTITSTNGDLIFN